MSTGILQRIPVVAGLGYRERVRALPSPFMAVLAAEPENRYFPDAIAVLVDGAKVGYVAPEIARRYIEAVKSWTGPPLTCPGRRGTTTDHESSGVELLLDFSNLSVKPGE